MRRRTRYTILDNLDEPETVELRPKAACSLTALPTGGVDTADLQRRRWREPPAH